MQILFMGGIPGGTKACGAVGSGERENNRQIDPL